MIKVNCLGNSKGGLDGGYFGERMIDRSRCLELRSDFMSEELLCKTCLRSKQRRLEALAHFLGSKKKKQPLYKLSHLLEHQEYSMLFSSPS